MGDDCFIVISWSGGLWGEGHKTRQARFAEYIRNCANKIALEITIKGHGEFSHRHWSGKKFAPISLVQLESYLKSLGKLRKICLLDTYEGGLDRNVIALLDAIDCDKVFGYGECVYRRDEFDGFICPYDNVYPLSSFDNLYQSSEYLLVDIDYTDSDASRLIGSTKKTDSKQPLVILCFLTGGEISKTADMECRKVILSLSRDVEIARWEIVSSDCSWKDSLGRWFEREFKQEQKLVFSDILDRIQWNEKMKSADICIGSWGGAAIMRVLHGLFSVNICIAENQHLVRTLLQDSPLAVDSEKTEVNRLGYVLDKGSSDNDAFQKLLNKKLLNAPVNLLNLLKNS